MIVNSANLRSAYVGFSAAYQAGLLAAPPPTYSRICMEVPSTTRGNEYGWLGQMPRFREWVGERVIQSIGEYGYYIRNRSFENTIGVNKDDIEDDSLGIYAPLFQDFGRTAVSFPDELAWPLLPGGLVTRCYDGQNFFDTDHPVLDAGGNVTSVSNFDAGSSPAWYLIDQSRGLKPLVFQSRKKFQFVRMDSETDEEVFSKKEFRYGLDGRCNVGYGFWQVAHCSKQPLDSAGYAAARTAMLSQKGDYGRPLNLLMGAKPLLIVPPSLEQQALTLINAAQNASGATNIWRDTAEVMLSNYLA